MNGNLTSSHDHIYECSNFSPIPFQAGDVLGVFYSDLAPLSEDTPVPPVIALIAAAVIMISVTVYLGKRTNDVIHISVR